METYQVSFPSMGPTYWNRYLALQPTVAISSSDGRPIKVGISYFQANFGWSKWATRVGRPKIQTSLN